LSWEFLSKEVEQAGAGGGILYHLLGTLILIGTALGVSAPLAFGIVLVHQVYLKSRRARQGLTLWLYTLNGVPSILFGLFGFIVFVKGFGWGKSWLAGGIVLGWMMLPTVAVAWIERMAVVPVKHLEAAAGLGLSQTQRIWSILMPQSIGGWVTGSLLGLARAAGETAPIMFTAVVFAGATLPDGIRQNPVLALPYHIFVLAQDTFDPVTRPKLWGTALILIGLVFLFSLIALPVRVRMHEEARYD
jgi:phosphate transport system permease protein